MPTELDRPWELDSHDSVFAHGWEYGYVQAKIEERADFERDVLASHLTELVSLLRAASAVVCTGSPERRRYSVEFVPLRVEFPRGKEL